MIIEQLSPAEALRASLNDAETASMLAMLAAAKGRPLPPRAPEQRTTFDGTPMQTETPTTATVAAEKTPTPKSFPKTRAFLGRMASRLASVTRPIWDASYETKREKQSRQEYEARVNAKLDVVLGSVSVAEVVTVQVETVTTESTQIQRVSVWHDLVGHSKSTGNSFNAFETWTAADDARFQAHANQNDDTLVLSR